MSVEVSNIKEDELLRTIKFKDQMIEKLQHELEVAKVSMDLSMD